MSASPVPIPTPATHVSNAKIREFIDLVKRWTEEDGLRNDDLRAILVNVRTWSNQVTDADPDTTLVFDWATEISTRIYNFTSDSESSAEDVIKRLGEINTQLGIITQDLPDVYRELGQGDSQSMVPEMFLLMGITSHLATHAEDLEVRHIIERYPL